MAHEYFDVLIAGAGISGVGGACRQAGVATQIDVRV
jgi:cation diffusion facilitator CzcD-associated flavoprotein CzcO